MNPFSFFKSSSTEKPGSPNSYLAKMKLIPETYDERIRARYPIHSLRIEGDKIIEYANDVRQYQLTYPQKGRSHYQVGDIIFIRSLPKHILERSFPELRDTENSVPCLDMLLFVLFDEWPPNYTYGWRIEKIRDGFWKEALLRVVLIFPDMGVVELQQQEFFSNSRLTLSLIRLRATMGLEFIIKISQTIVHGSVKLLPFGISGFGIKVLLKKGSRKFLKYNLYKKIFKILLDKIVLKAATSAFVALVEGALKDISRELERQELLVQVDARIAELSWRPIVAKSIKTIMDRFFTIVLKELVPYKKYLGGANTLSRIEQFFLKRMVPHLIQYTLQLLIRFYSTMLKHLVQSRRKFPEGWWKEYSGEIVKEIQHQFSEFLKSELKKFEVPLYLAHNE